MWEIELEFAICDEGLHEESGHWYGDEPVGKTFTFTTEAAARAFFEEAHQVLEAGWGDFDEPAKALLEFPRKHEVTVFDLDGAPCGGFYKGEPVPGCRLALQFILRVVEVQDVKDLWVEEMTDDS